MAWTTEELNPTLIENTTMVKHLLDGVPKTYWITPNEGYVLHDRRLDEFAEYDEEGNGIGEATRLRYYEGTRTVSVNYDFDNVVVDTDGNTTVNKIGEYELYAISR